MRWWVAFVISGAWIEVLAFHSATNLSLYMIIVSCEHVEEENGLSSICALLGCSFVLRSIL